MPSKPSDVRPRATSVARATTTGEDRSPAPTTKDRILDCAEELFAQQGFAGARTRDIASRAGVNVSTLHFHWNSKEDLYAAVHKQQVARRAALADKVLAVFARTEHSPERWQLVSQEITDLLFEFFRCHPRAARLDSYLLLETAAPNSTLAQRQALLFAVVEALRTFLPKELATTADVALNILSVNALLREYFAKPEGFGQLVGEPDPERMEARLRRHVQQHVLRLLQMIDVARGQPAVKEA